MAGMPATNSCCLVWKEKYSNLEGKRNALRQAVKVFELEFAKLQTQNLNLEKAISDEKEEREKLLADKVCLEDEISVLKSEICSLKQKDANGLQQLEDRVSEGKTEINRLEGVLKKERRKIASVEAEKKKAVEALKREVDEVRSKLGLEKGDGLKRLQDQVDEGKTEINRLQGLLKKETRKAGSVEVEKNKVVEILRREADELRSKLVLETCKFDEVGKKFELEKRKADKERKRADVEKAKAEEQRKLVDAYKKSAGEERCRAELLSKLEEEHRQKIEELQKEITVLLSARKSNVEAVKVSSRKDVNTEAAEVKFLKKQLKFEKNRAKHEKQVATLERTRNSILLQELGKLKVEFVQFSRHLNFVDNCFLPGLDEELKKTNARDMQMLNRKRAWSSAVNSSMTSLSDGQLNVQPTVTSLFKSVDEKLNVQPTVSSLFREVTKMRSNENFAVVAQNNVNPARIDNVLREVDERGRNNMILDAVESIEYMNLEGKKLQQQMNEKLQVLLAMLKGRMNTSEEGRCMVPDLQGFSDVKDRISKKRKMSHVENTVMPNSCDTNINTKMREDYEIHDDSHLSEQETMARFDDVTDGDYMKLLDLDDPVEEEKYKVAMDRPLTPTLPEILFQNVEALDLGCSKDFVEESFCAGLLSGKGSRVPSRNFDVINEEIDSNKLNQFQSKLGSVPSTFCIVLPHIKDSSSISRIFCATRTCIARCSLALQKDWAIKTILLVLKKEENVLPEEKVCVFFSLLVLNFRTAAPQKFGKAWDSVACFESFNSNIRAVMSDVETRGLFTELCCLDELFALMEEFLVDAKDMVYEDAPSETLFERDSTLSSKDASPDLLVAGSIILASICTAINHIDIIYEAAYNIFRSRWRDSSLTLTILHIFAYLGGEKLFSLSNCLTMTVLKSLVTYLERTRISVPSASPLPPMSNIKLKFFTCSKCPFADSAVSVDTVTSSLLDKLQNYALSGAGNLELKYEILTTQPNSNITSDLYHLSDILSLVELVACIMGWDWACVKVVPELLKMLESKRPGNFTAAIVILLGQLGLLGIDASGYEEKGVENLRCKLTAFLCQSSTMKAGLHIQIAIVTALLGLLSLDFKKIIQRNVNLPLIVSHSVSADAIREWFSLLSKEQQVLSCSLLQSAYVYEI